jgi:uncharacterized RDD family membrane protein YckC
VRWRPWVRRLFSPDPDDVAVSSPANRSPDLASPRARLLAATLDVSIMAVALFSVGAVGFDPAFGGDASPLRFAARLLAWVAVLGHVVVLEGASGQTIGKRLVGIRVVRQDSGGPIGYWTAAHRAAPRALFWFVAFLAVTDPHMRALHDRSAGTIVVRIPPGPAGGGSEPGEVEHTDRQGAQGL